MYHSPGFLALVNDAKSRIRQTDVHTIHRRMQNGDRFYFIDIREESEWAAGHLPNALHIGRGILERDIERTIPDHSAEIVLYCGGGYRSALSADNLRKMGYTNVVSMDGGFRGWTEAGFPTADEDRP